MVAVRCSRWAFATHCSPVSIRSSGASWAPHNPKIRFARSSRGRLSGQWWNQFKSHLTDVFCELTATWCSSTKAIHYELVSGLTVCLKHFVGTLCRFRWEWTGLLEFMKATQKLDATSHRGINWRLISYHTPYFGGLWESAVKNASRGDLFQRW